jgi:LysM repeat protein
MERLISATTLFALALSVTPAAAQTLRGSRGSVEKQYGAALEHDFSFLQSSSQVKRFATRGLLVSLPGNANYDLAGVSFPFARPAVKTFVERLARQYRSACGEPLIVTSLTRPTARQPRNASDQSVHPAGMAVDLRISRKSKCRSWIERVLVSLEGRGVLEATRERFPAHYHIAVFPNTYLAYIGQPGVRLAQAKVADADVVAEEAASAVTVAPAATVNLADAAGDSASAGSGTAVASDSAAVAAAAAAAGNATIDTAATAGADPAPVAAAAHSAADDPAGKAETPARAAPVTSVYRVNRGDTLWSIARRHGVTVSALKALNGLSGSRIKAGQRLRVPAGVAN